MGGAALIVEFRRSREVYDGFIAAMAATRSRDPAVSAAATKVLIKASHSAWPVASNSRNVRTRDMDQSTAANADAGARSISAFDRG